MTDILKASCRECAFCAVGEKVGECRASPPTPLIEHGSPVLIHDDRGGHYFRIWPVVCLDFDWCGAFTPKAGRPS